MPLRRLGLFAVLCLSLTSLARAERLLIPAEITDAPLTDTSQIVNNYFGANTIFGAGVNFHFGSPGPATGPGRGFGIHNININTTPGGPIGPVALTGNYPGVTLTVTGYVSDERNQSVNLSGADDTVFEALAGDIMYLGAGNAQTISFDGLGANREVFVQLIGGDAGWSGDIDVNANGGDIGIWDTVADGSSATASIYAFTANADALGGLDIQLLGLNQFSGIAGVLLSLNEFPPPPLAPEPSSWLLMGAALAGAAGWQWRRRRNP